MHLVTIFRPHLARDDVSPVQQSLLQRRQLTFLLPHRCGLLVDTHVAQSVAQRQWAVLESLMHQVGLQLGHGEPPGDDTHGDDAVASVKRQAIEHPQCLSRSLHHWVAAWPPRATH
jgi:hypothetical protein